MKKFISKNILNIVFFVILLFYIIYIGYSAVNDISLDRTLLIIGFLTLVNLFTIKASRNKKDKIDKE